MQAAARWAVSLYHMTTEGTRDTVPEGAQWFESYLESTNGGATFSAPKLSIRLQ